MTENIESPRSRLISEAEYLIAEIAFGDAVSVDVLVKAKPYIEALSNATVAAKSATAGDAEFSKLQLALIEVMVAIGPVSLTSLHDTDCSGKPRRWWFSHYRQSVEPGKPDERVEEVELFSDNLVIFSILFLILALSCTLAILVGRHDELTDAARVVAAAEPNMLAKAVAKLKDALAKPVADWITAVVACQTVIFGGLGACTFLLRALHKHIHERTFDRRYKPEYVNRVVLGMVSGGVVTMLVQQTDLLKDLAGIGSAALAFIVGYNTDLLFSLLERISNALFPKVPDTPGAATVATPIIVQDKELGKDPNQGASPPARTAAIPLAANGPLPGSPAPDRPAVVQAE